MLYYCVVTSKVEEYNSNPAFGMKHPYGIDDGSEFYYLGIDYEEELNWEKAQFPKSRVFTVKVIADGKGK